MSYYYQYNFISPEPTYSVVKEELKSYFDTGAIDTLMFPTYTSKCLEKLGKTGYDIFETYLYIEDFQARLPDDFKMVREAWMCTAIYGAPYRSANSFYSQAASTDTIQISPVITNESCQNVDCVDADCTDCMPTLIQAVYKTNNEINVSYNRSFLLKPGNIRTRQYCATDCANYGSSAADSFDIDGNKFVTNFREGTVHLIFYGTEYDGIGNILIPDNYRIKEYIEKFLKFKMFETLSNQVVDETFNQIQLKKNEAKQEADEAYVLADIEIKKQTAYQKQRAIKKNLDSFNKYELPGSSTRINRYWRSNGSGFTE